MIKLKNLLNEMSVKSFNKIAKQFYSKLSEDEIIALRSWIINLKNPGKGYINKVKAKKFIQNSSNIQKQSQNLMKSIFGTEPFYVYRSYYEHEGLGTGLRSYTISPRMKFGGSGKVKDKKQVTYKDVFAVPGIAFYKWSEAGGYSNEGEVVIKT
jgi:hypothetical protein